MSKTKELMKVYEVAKRLTLATAKLNYDSSLGKLKLPTLKEGRVKKSRMKHSSVSMK
jgi:hypothetical protein